VRGFDPTFPCFLEHLQSQGKEILVDPIDTEQNNLIRILVKIIV